MGSTKTKINFIKPFSFSRKKSKCNAADEHLILKIHDYQKKLQVWGITQLHVLTQNCKIELFPFLIMMAVSDFRALH